MTKKILKAARTKKYYLQYEKTQSSAALLVRNYANKTENYIFTVLKGRKMSIQDFRFHEKKSFKVKGEISTFSVKQKKMN